MSEDDLLEWLDEQLMTQRDLGNAETAAMYEAAWKAVRERDEARQEYLAERTARMEANAREYVVEQALTEARAEIERLTRLLELYRDAVTVDATMEGPRFGGSNASALRRAWEADRAALAPATPPAQETEEGDT